MANRWMGHLLLLVLASAAAHADTAQTLANNNAQLLQQLQQAHGLSEIQMQALRTLFQRSGVMGQGNPAITVYPLTPEQCRAARQGVEQPTVLASFQKICGAAHMAPLFDPTVQKIEDAAVCIDQYEFPDIPCAYPVVWVRAREAALICEAMGKRLCDAHEWEGACDGRLLPPDYRFDLVRGSSPTAGIERLRNLHNKTLVADARWSYGPQYQRGVCGTASFKTASCPGGGWGACGSNTYPSGSFPQCRSPLGVYDLHGNAAEHMNLPLQASQMASRGSTMLGYTEMKGSWFIFDRYYAHPDWCRWRAPPWHLSRVMDAGSHANYHLGFRCCKTLATR